MKLLGEIGHGAMGVAMKYAQTKGAKLFNYAKAAWDVSPAGLVSRAIQMIRKVTLPTNDGHSRRRL
jgi:hypothetical protein